MKPAIFKKHVWEERRLEFDVSDALALGDSLASITGVAVLLDDEEQSAMLSGAASSSGNKVYQVITGGVADNRYIIRVRIVTTNGDKIEDSVIMLVEE